MSDILEDYLRQERFFKTVVEDGSDIIFIVDYQANILYHNPSVHATLGYTSLVGENFLSYVNVDTHNVIKKNLEVSTAKPYNANIEFDFKRADGEYMFLEFNSINLRFKDDINALILDCRDISDRKKHQEELIRAQKTKEQFLANMSHEIRTPINGIVGMVNLLSGTVESPEQIKYLDAIQHAADNLKVIINDILDFSVIESGKLTLEKIGFDVDYQMKHIIDSFNYQAEEKGLKLNYTYKEGQRRVLLGDPVRLNQVLINLVNNAIKFTHNGSITVDLSFDVIEDQKVMANFSVQDTGIGIAPEKLKSIFEIFKQADESITRKFGGTGLGLTICKQLVELQNGSISVESIINEGTTFHFSIPYDLGRTSDLIYQDNHKHQQAGDKHKSLTGMKVLLVEDNDINRLYAANVLRKWDCYYDEAENGVIALEKLRKKDYDIILMDVQMPVLDGLEASKSIRASFPEPKNKTPIVAFTANAIKGDRDKCLAAGMDEYISKPFLPEDLYEILTKFQRSGTSFDKNQVKLTDLTYLRSLSDNDEQFVQDMVTSFVEKTPILINQLISASESQDWPMVGSLAHKLKPNLAFMGIEELKSLVLDVELSGKDSQQLEALPAKIERLTSRCFEAIDELKSELENF